MLQCVECQVETSNPKFCSRSCAAKYNNRVPKRKATISKCGDCKITIPPRNKYCKTCRDKRNTRGDITLSEAVYEYHYRSSAFALVRSRARKALKENRPKICEWCGYDKHAEAAHIVPIRNFSDDTKISVINDLSNLLWLCPNCHWEHDHKLK